jgi:hypothetical protein
MLVERLAPTLKEPTCRSEQDEDCTFAGRTTSGRVTTRFAVRGTPGMGPALVGDVKVFASPIACASARSAPRIPSTATRILESIRSCSLRSRY